MKYFNTLSVYLFKMTKGRIWWVGILKYLGDIFYYLVCLFVQDDEGKDMVGGGPWRGALPNLRVRPSGGEKTPEKYYCP